MENVIDIIMLRNMAVVPRNTVMDMVRVSSVIIWMVLVSRWVLRLCVCV